MSPEGVSICVLLALGLVILGRILSERRTASRVCWFSALGIFAALIIEPFALPGFGFTMLDVASSFGVPTSWRIAMANFVPIGCVLLAGAAGAFWGFAYAPSQPDDAGTP